MAWTQVQFASAFVLGTGNIASGTAAFTDTGDSPFAASMVGFGISATTSGANLDTTLKTFVSSSAFTLNANAPANAVNLPYALANNPTIDTNGTTVLTITMPTALAVGDAVAVEIFYLTGITVSSLVDSGASGGNTYTNAFTHSAGGADMVVRRTVATKAISGNWTITITMSGSVTGVLQAYVHHARPPAGYKAVFGPTAVADAGGVSGTAMNSGNITTTTPNSIAFGWFIPQNAVTATTATWSVDSSQVSGGTFDVYGNAAEHIIETGIATIAATGTQATGVWVAGIASFGAIPNVNAVYYGSD